MEERLSSLEEETKECVEKLSAVLSERLVGKRYLNPRATGGAIWNIFYMHCADPLSWPIFDQHTYRAMRFMKTGKVAELPKTKAKIYQAYNAEYLPFVRLLNSEPRKVDRALFAFGKFLKAAERYLPRGA